jgi:tetratricopeptide (TPR) repeat protein
VAIEAFERAVAADPDYAYAQAWLAQLLVWRSEPEKKWGPHVSAALRTRASLDIRENLLLDALQAIQQGHNGQACTAYDELRKTDSLDASSWLGLAHCNATNRLVVHSGNGSGEWAFQGSIAEAQRSYARALQISPAAFSAFPFTTISRLFVFESLRYRLGANADSASFFGFPDVIGDTIAYVARPFKEIGRTAVANLAPNYERALKLNRDVLLGILSTLTQRVPDDPDAFEALANVLEASDQITGTPNGGYSALSALDRAKALATDTVQRARLGASDVRLHLKLGDFSRTAAIGDSILASSPAVAGIAATHLMGIAALLGRERAAAMYARSSGFTVALDGAPTVPLLEDVSTALFMRTALGVCDDSVRALKRRIGELLESYVSAAQREQARTGLLKRPTYFGLNCFGARSSLVLQPDASLIQVVQSLGRGDTSAARARLDSLQKGRSVMRPGEYSLDYTLTEALLRMALSDTAQAIRQLDLTLTALPTLTPHIVFEPGMAAAVGRSMVLRAELAARRGDPLTAALWAGRVLTLWAHADPSLAPTLARMRDLASRRS